jgi:peptidyl-prolyl cis-trans isomerase C
MATLYQHPTLAQSLEADGPRESYSGPVEIDVKLPPTARPIFSAVSVNGVAIPEADILAEAQNHPAESPGAALVAAARALVVRELFLQEARRLGIEARPDTDHAGRSETEEDALIRALIEKELVVPTAAEAECRRFYENNPHRFASEPIFEARHILLAASQKDEAARNTARQDAEQLIAQLRERPADFAALALQYSDCPSKEQGGNLGQLTRGATVAEFEMALGTMAEGELSARPVESRFGYHIILLERRIAGTQLPFEMVRERIAAWLEASSWSKAVAQYVKILAGRAKIVGIDISAADSPLIQ